MQTIGTTFDGSATAASIGFAGRIRQAMREVLRLLARLVPPRPAGHDSALSPEFFEYPPV